MVGDDFTVSVLEAKGDHVCVGITAPKAILVHHDEVFMGILREQKAARAAG